MVRSQLRDFPSASVAHGASYCMDVLRVTRSSAPFDWLFDAFGPIVWLRRRGFYRSGGGDRLQTYKRCLESRGEEGKIRKKNIWRRRRGGGAGSGCVCVGRGQLNNHPTSGAVVCEYANIVREVAPAREASANRGDESSRNSGSVTRSRLLPSARSPAS